MPTGLLFTGDALDILKTLEKESVHCAVTSPPYWGLRDYGTNPVIWGGSSVCEHVWVSENRVGMSGGGTNRNNAGSRFAGSTCSTCSAWRGSLGLEPSPEQYVSHLALIFREVRRVLRDDGTLWINIGDSYAGGGRGGNPKESTYRKQATNYGSVSGITSQKWNVPSGIKPKDLVGIPWALAFALRADGWYLRQDIIWQKLNPMPESVTDRCVKAHEYFFLLSKSKDYFFDHVAIQEPSIRAGKRPGGRRYSSFDVVGMSTGGVHTRESLNEKPVAKMRNKRSVWMTSLHPFKGSHFATFPPDLIEPCILSGTSEFGCCTRCGAPYVRQTKVVRENCSNAAIAGTVIAGKGHPTDQVRENHDIRNGPVTEIETLGWKKLCECAVTDTVPCTVLDPFSGAATTGLVSLKNKRGYIGIEANPEYNNLAEKRLVAAGLDCAVL